MSFEWNVEEMALINNNSNVIHKGRKIYNFEGALTREDKIAFVDKIHDGKLSYLLYLLTEFEADKDSLCKDNYGGIKTVSLKAWLKKHDNRHMVDDWYHYGKVNFLGCERYITYNALSRKGTWDYYEDLVDEVFNRQLRKCIEAEKEYFKRTDKYEILKTRLHNYCDKYGTTFGVHMGWCSDGRIFVYDDNSDGVKREITIDEAQTLVNAYEKLEDEINKITLDIDIKY